MQEQLRELIRKHCVTLARRIADLGTVLQQLPAASNEYAMVLMEAREIAHQLTGASGSMGFRAISVASQTLERYLEELSDAGAPPPQPALRRITQLFAELKATADAAKPETSSLYHADLSTLQSPTGASGRG